MAARDGSGGPGPTGDLVALICEDEADDVRAAHALLDAGADPNGYVAARDTTPLHEAVAWNRLRIAQALLERGGRVDLTLPRAPHAPPSALSLLRAGPFRPAIWRAALSLGLMNLLGPRFPEGLDLGDRTLEEECCSKPMARLLVRHGADPMRLDAEYRPAATGADLIAPREVTPDLFKRQATPRPGTANPEPCDDAFLIEQIRTGRSGYAAGKAVMGTRHSRLDTGPVWSFARFGQSATRLPDGRLVLIAGEHEDHYDPDFCIYNDVTVLDRTGGVQHFLYPRELFPPTDFHSATLVGDGILLIGSLGYPEARRDGDTQVLRLDLGDFSIAPVETQGEKPGWIHRHKAELTDAGIRVTGGKIEPGYRDRTETHLLDLSTWIWRLVG